MRRRARSPWTRAALRLRAAHSFYRKDSGALDRLNTRTRMISAVAIGMRKRSGSENLFSELARIRNR